MKHQNGNAESNPKSETSFELSIEATDELSGIALYEIYVDGIKNEEGTFNGTELKTLVNMREMGNYNTNIVIVDVAGNKTEVVVKARTLLYAWKTYDIKTKQVIRQTSGPVMTTVKEYAGSKYHHYSMTNVRSTIFEIENVPWYSWTGNAFTYEVRSMAERL